MAAALNALSQHVASAGLAVRSQTSPATARYEQAGAFRTPAFSGARLSYCRSSKGQPSRMPVVSALSDKSAAVEVDSDTETDTVGFLPNGEWAENFSLLTVEDLREHLTGRRVEEILEEEEEEEEGVSAVAEIDQSLGVISGEWSNALAFSPYKEDLFSFMKAHPKQVEEENDGEDASLGVVSGEWSNAYAFSPFKDDLSAYMRAHPVRKTAKAELSLEGEEGNGDLAEVDPSLGVVSGEWANGLAFAPFKDDLKGHFRARAQGSL